PVLGSHRRALDDRQEAALHALARDVRAVDALAAGDLVDLVDEDDARLLDAPDRLLGGGLHVDEARGFLLGERIQRLGDPHARLLRLARHQVLEEVAQTVLDFLHALRRHHLDHGGDRARHLDLDHAVLELPLAQHAPELLARRGLVGRRRGTFGLAADRLDPSLHPHGGQQEVEHSLLGQLAGADADLLLLLLAHHVDRDLGEVADDRLDVAADVAHLGELRGLHLDEGRLRQLGEPTRDLRLSHPRRPDHDDVLRCDLLAQRLGHVHPPPAVAERDRDRPLGGTLADDVAVELGHDLARGEGGHGQEPSISSIVSWSLVKTQIAAAARIASSAMARAGRSAACLTSTRAAASAKLPPEPIAQMPSSGSMTSPLPDTTSDDSRSATTRSASRRRSSRSVRQSLASSTAARRRLPLTCPSFASKRSKSAMASAPAPANPASTRSW